MCVLALLINSNKTTDCHIFLPNWILIYYFYVMSYIVKNINIHILRAYISQIRKCFLLTLDSSFRQLMGNYLFKSDTLDFAVLPSEKIEGPLGLGTLLNKILSHLRLSGWWTSKQRWEGDTNSCTLHATCAQKSMCQTVDRYWQISQ